MTQALASRQRFWLVFLLFLHTVNTYMDRVCISAAKGAMQNDISGLDDQMMGVWDGNRFNEPTSPDARFTFGEALIEGNGGSLRLYGNGQLTLQRLGENERDINYDCNKRGFAGDCVLATQQHFVECFRAGSDFETSGSEYLKSLSVVEAIYKSAETRMPVRGWRKEDK